MSQTPPHTPPARRPPVYSATRCEGLLTNGSRILTQPGYKFNLTQLGEITTRDSRRGFGSAQVASALRHYHAVHLRRSCQRFARCLTAPRNCVAVKGPAPAVI